MVKYTLKKRNNKSKIKRKVKKSIKKTFKKSLKNKRKKVFRKSINKKTKNYKKKKGGVLGFIEGKTCSEVGTTNNLMKIPFYGDLHAPFNYYERIKPLVDSSLSIDNRQNIGQAGWHTTYKKFISSFLASYGDLNRYSDKFADPNGGASSFKRRIDKVLNDNSVSAAAYNSVFGKELSGKFRPRTFEDGKKETVDMRIFNLLLHEFDHFTCDVGIMEPSNTDDKVSGKSTNAEFSKHASGPTNFKEIKSIKEFLSKFTQMRGAMSMADGNIRRTDIHIRRKFRFITLIRLALARTLQTDIEEHTTD